MGVWNDGTVMQRRMGPDGCPSTDRFTPEPA